jgi:hypothetical protein
MFLTVQLSAYYIILQNVVGVEGARENVHRSAGEKFK